MDTSLFEDLAAGHFGLAPSGSAREIAAGNINATALVPTTTGLFVIQDINKGVFSDPSVLMRNAQLVVERQIAHNIPAMEHQRTIADDWLAVHDGTSYRCYRFIEGAATPSITTAETAQANARAFGRYAKAIDGLALVEHLSGYHNFDLRVDSLDKAVAVDSHARLAGCARHVEDMLSMVDRLRLTSAFAAWLEVPVRNAHNDAKGPNCIVGDVGRTIIDLDTTMPGTVLSDIGELVRSSTRDMKDAGPEDLMVQVTAANRGFLSGYGNDLEDSEEHAMLLAGPLMTTENAVRFMTDHLSGDTYYGAAYPDQNLERAIVQLELAQRLVEAIELATAGLLSPG